MKALPVIILALALSGCATQFGTRIVHHHKVVAAAPIVAPAPIPAPAKPTFKERFKAAFKGHKLKWVH